MHRARCFRATMCATLMVQLNEPSGGYGPNYRCYRNAWTAAFEGLRSESAKDLKSINLRAIRFLRHIIGNPFRTQPALSHVPIDVRELADTVHQHGQQGVAPLRDALLDANLSIWRTTSRMSLARIPKGVGLSIY